MSEIPGELKKLVENNTSGSREILIQLNETLRSYFKESKNKEELLDYLTKNFNEFSAIVNYLKELREVYKKNPSGLEKFFLDFSVRENENIKIIYDKIKPYFTGIKKFLTLSNSKTVSEILIKHFKEGNNFEVVVSESRPAFEGRIMAELLADTGVKVFLITEAMLSEFAKKCDAGIIGADKILPDGGILNKTGSLTLAIALRYYKKPLYVTADKSKRTDEIAPEIKEYSPQEIYDGEKSVINITNKYFEKVDETLITKLITD